ncbi:hypothetical protein EDD16DRAFT_1569697 [Pisolithus croceorrhizus]|nr:hypothetical protein EDD16DRAFT_1569697 [Pisolithus croceorrhizus]
MPEDQSTPSDAHRTNQSNQDNNIFIPRRLRNFMYILSIGTPTCASFLTTSRPTDIANWSRPFPYLCILAGIVFALLSVLSGVGLLGFINAIQPNTVREIQPNHLKFALTVTLLIMPFLCLFTSGLASITRYLGAVWFGNSTWARTGVTIGFAWFILMIFVILGSIY